MTYEEWRMKHPGKTDEELLREAYTLLSHWQSRWVQIMDLLDQDWWAVWESTKTFTGGEK